MDMRRGTRETINIPPPPPPLHLKQPGPAPTKETVFYWHIDSTMSQQPLQVCWPGTRSDRVPCYCRR